MRIAFVKQKYVPFGGGEGYLAGLLDACAEKGHEVHVITTGWDNSQRFPFAIHVAQLQRLSRRSRVISFAASVAEIVQKNSFDVVFSLERTTSQQIWRAGDCVYSKWLKQRSLYEPSLHSLFNRLSFGQRAVVEMERRCVESTPFIIANSEMIRRDLQEAYPEMQSRVEVIYNGYDPSRFSLTGKAEDRRQIRHQLGLAEEQPILLFVASGWRRKGLLELLQALQELPEVKLLVLGRDKTAEWKKSARKLGVDSQVVFLEPRNDIQRLYHAVDATLLPSWYDSFGFVTLESLACGTPAIVSRFAGSHELIRPGVNGMVIGRPDEIPELRAAIVETLRLRSYAAIGESVSSFTLANNVAQTLAVIERSVA
ncbi:MAG: glycosyltransferase family 4 protein [Desulfuromonadales bacterium]|nr:glycosyltransferase family 4 protein [Desulfuromonadales bacterium]